MGYKVGVDKKQLSLLPVCLDDYVPEDHICRVIHAFTGQLDFTALGFKYAECKSTGRRPYDPRLMLNLYIYGYLHRVRSSRRLQAEAARNVEVMWLMDGLTPDDKTICNFRKDNTRALRETFRAFVQMCRRLGLYGEELVATDSMKVRAQNSLSNNYNRTVVENELSRIEKRINKYLDALEESDTEGSGEETPSTASIKAALDALRQRQVDFTELHHWVTAEGEISTTDPESRLMRSGGDNRKLDVCYNVHTVVDSKYHLVADFAVNNCSSDAGQLGHMSMLAQEALEAAELTNLADMGYYDGNDIASCERRGVRCLIAKPAIGSVKKAAEFRTDRFVYDEEKDVYICPCKQEMAYVRDRKKPCGREYRVYVNYQACRQCPRKSECTGYRYREMYRLPCQSILDLVASRTRNKPLYRMRQEIVEHVFGTVKAVWGYRQYLCRGKSKVTAETSLAYMAYNIRRAFNIFTESRLQLRFS
jgi:transposase